MAIKVRHDVPMSTLGPIAYGAGRGEKAERDRARADQLRELERRRVERFMQMQYQAERDAVADKMRGEAMAYQKEKDVADRRHSLDLQGLRAKETDATLAARIREAEIQQAGRMDLASFEGEISAADRQAGLDRYAMGMQGEIDLTKLRHDLALHADEVQRQREMEAKRQFTPYQTKLRSKIANEIDATLQAVEEGEITWDMAEGSLVKKQQYLDSMVPRGEAVVTIADTVRSQTYQDADGNIWGYDRNGLPSIIKGAEENERHIAFKDYVAIRLSVIDAMTIVTKDPKTDKETLTLPSEDDIDKAIRAALNGYYSYTDKGPVAQDEAVSAGGEAGPITMRDLETGQERTIDGSVSPAFVRATQDPETFVKFVSQKYGKKEADRVRKILDTKDQDKIKAMLKVLGL